MKKKLILLNDNKKDNRVEIDVEKIKSFMKVTKNYEIKYVVLFGEDDSLIEFTPKELLHYQDEEFNSLWKERLNVYNERKYILDEIDNKVYDNLKLISKKNKFESIQRKIYREQLSGKEYSIFLLERKIETYNNIIGDKLDQWINDYLNFEITKIEEIN